VSLVGDAQAASKKAISKTKMPVSADCLITAPNLSAGHFRCNQRQETAVTEAAYSLNDKRDNSEVPRAHSRLAAGSI